jgi:transketolase
MHAISQAAKAIRFLAVDAIFNAGEGHQGVPLGMAEIAATLYLKHLKIAPKNPLWTDRDRVVLSNGHGSMLLYALLHLSGYEKVGVDAIKSFRKLHSVCAGHPEIDQEAGIEITTGLLGQGIANAVGMAVAEQRLQAQFGPDLVEHRTWAFVGDGCFQEGMGQEAISLAGHLRLSKLTFLWDDNSITDDGATHLSISEDVCARFRVAHWHVVEVDGHDVAQIDAALSAAKSDSRPSLIACKTTIAKGIARLEGQRGGHSAPLTQQDIDAMRDRLDWPHAPFVIPQEIYDTWDSAMAQGQDQFDAWCVRHQNANWKAEFDRWHSADLPASYEKHMHTIKTELSNNSADRATITSSGDVCDLLNDILPELQILCADLEAPTNHKRSRTSFLPNTPHGSYVHCGVREHLMGAMADGIAAHGGLRPVNVTYLAFADYERAAMRMAALMKLPTVYVFSHDSIGVGSNGPTHQPVEVLASFRAMPNFHVIRPADAVETTEAWDLALTSTQTPTLLALAKQDCVQISTYRAENKTAKGGYLLEEIENRDITLIATGSEVALAVAAQQELNDAGLSVAVVSLPCWELFDQQNHSYKNHVLGDAPRIAIEAGVEFGWQKYLRPTDHFIGMQGFGESARAEILYAHFGISTAQIVTAAQRLVKNQLRPI